MSESHKKRWALRPRNPEQWQDAVDAARFYLILDSCVQYGLVKWDGKVDVDRCLAILAQGEKRGFVPEPDETLIPRMLA